MTVGRFGPRSNRPWTMGCPFVSKSRAFAPMDSRRATAYSAPRFTSALRSGSTETVGISTSSSSTFSKRDRSPSANFLECPSRSRCPWNLLPAFSGERDSSPSEDASTRPSASARRRRRLREAAGRSRTTRGRAPAAGRGRSPRAQRRPGRPRRGSGGGSARIQSPRAAGPLRPSTRRPPSACAGLDGRRGEEIARRRRSRSGKRDSSRGLPARSGPGSVTPKRASPASGEAERFQDSCRRK